MKISRLVIMALSLTGLSFAAAGDVPPAPNGITLPENYKDWRVIASSSRIDNNTLRIILGNDIAVAARSGNTNPWPDGAILGKMVWKDTTLKAWEKAVVPGEFVHAEFMFKDTEKWKDTGGWHFARWKGMDQAVYGKDASFANECFSCHTPVKNYDYVFTHPAQLP